MQKHKCGGTSTCRNVGVQERRELCNRQSVHDVVGRRTFVQQKTIYYTY